MKKASRHGTVLHFQSSSVIMVGKDSGGLLPMVVFFFEGWLFFCFYNCFNFLLVFFQFGGQVVLLSPGRLIR